MKLLVVSPCRNEAAHLEPAAASVLAQTRRPDLWIIVDDGSSDRSGEAVAALAREHDWIRVIRREDRGFRSVGPGVVDAVLDGLSAAGPAHHEFFCKLDLDVVLPHRYFETLLERMRADPRLGVCSGKPWHRDAAGRLRPEICGDELAVGMAKFYRRECFDQIGGLVREVMWDAIDCHKARSLGWKARSWNDPELRFEHLRRTGASQSGILEGKRRHGYGQYFMGTHWLYFLASVAYRMAERPYVLGGLAMAWGYFGALLSGAGRQEDAELIRFIRAFQLRALVVGKARATEEFEAARSAMWRPAEAPLERNLQPTF